jgi:VanZ family protein
VVVASADEYHQSFLPSRTGRSQDVLLDTAGAALFLLLLQLWLRFRWHASPLPDA